MSSQVLQDSAPDGAKLAAAFGEADSLRTQLSVYQSDREQLIAALTSKHQESVGFYEESRRLADQLAALGADAARRAREAESLGAQFEETKRSLCAALGELAALRQRRAELEKQLATATTSQPTAPAATFSIGPPPEEDSATAANIAASKYVALL